MRLNRATIATLATAGVAMAGMSVAQADAASLRPCDDPEYVTDRDDYVYAPLVLSSHYGRDCDMVWAGRGHGLFYELAMRIDRGKYPAPPASYYAGWRVYSMKTIRNGEERWGFRKGHRRFWIEQLEAWR